MFLVLYNALNLLIDLNIPLFHDIKSYVDLLCVALDMLVMMLP